MLVWNFKQQPSSPPPVKRFDTKDEDVQDGEFEEIKPTTTLQPPENPI
jgi:hypothetical protein